MPDRTSERQITGDDIISELLRNLDAGLFKIRFTTLAPSVYHVYLHPADFDFIKPVTGALLAESRRALHEKLDEYTRASQPSRLARTLGLESDRKVEYKLLDPDFTVDFYPDQEDRLKRGDIEIYSELASAARPDFGAGAMTRLITRKSADGQMSSEKTALQPTPEQSSGNAFAVIRYTGSDGPRAFEVTKNQIVIGRGGKSFWVDLKLDAPPDVSREHCRLRRDPATGTFYLKDVSQFGTSIDGDAAPSSIDTSGGETRDRNVEVPLPRKSTIGLAGVLFLEFEAFDRQ